jgi:uncharacterized protein (UPF0335 family)
MTDIGSNLAAVLRDTVQTIYDLEVDIKAAKDSKKDLNEKLKSESLKPALVMAMADQCDDERAAWAEDMKKTAALFGKPAYVGEVDTTELAEELGPDVANFVQTTVKALKATDEDIRKMKDEIKEELGKAKSAGLAPKIVTLMVDFRLHPKKRERFTKSSLLVEKYLEALGD